MPVTRDGGEILGWSFGNFFVTPEKLSGLRINPDESLGQRLDILFSPAPLNHDRRSISCRVAARDRRLPDDRARLFAERHDRGLRATGGHDNYVTINQRRLCIGPFAGLAAEF